MSEITVNNAIGELWTIVLSIITNAGSLVNDLGRLGIGGVNILLAVFGAKLPDVIVIANINISTALFINLVVIGGAFYVIYTKFGEALKSYIKIIGVGTGGLLCLSVVGALI